MTVSKDDWRLQGQQKYLQGARLFWSLYQIYRKDWDHDHCEFCGAKFCLDASDCLKEGYCTEDRYRWICQPCFDDFREMFQFQAVAHGANPRVASRPDNRRISDAATSACACDAGSDFPSVHYVTTSETMTLPPGVTCSRIQSG
jgi:hypothetical protein